MSIGLSILYIFRFENLFHFQALGIITLQWCKLVNLLNLISNFRHCKLIQKAFKFVICYWLKPVANLIFQKKKKTKQEIVIFTTNFYVPLWYIFALLQALFIAEGPVYGHVLKF